MSKTEKRPEEKEDRERMGVEGWVLEGSALSKIKISFGQTELLYLDPWGGLELPEAKVVVQGWQEVKL